MNETAIVGTKGFLFCDVRGYTAFVEARGDAAAAELLAKYRDLVRAAIAAHEGAEIRTEGDSVYVVFPAASGAVEAGVLPDRRGGGRGQYPRGAHPGRGRDPCR